MTQNERTDCGGQRTSCLQFHGSSSHQPISLPFLGVIVHHCHAFIALKRLPIKMLTVTTAISTTFSVLDDHLLRDRERERAWRQGYTAVLALPKLNRDLPLA